MKTKRDCGYFSMAKNKRLGMLGCEANPAPIENCMPCESLCSPPQALPPSFTSFTIPPDNVLIFHSCDGGVLDRCMNQGVENFTTWATWVENNVIKTWCELKTQPCHINYSAVDDKGVIQLKSAPIGKVIADCLGMSATKPHIVYDPTSKQAIAGKISITTIACDTFNRLLRTCPPKADMGVAPARVLGHDGSDTRNPVYYELDTSLPLKLAFHQQIGLSSNRYLGVAADTRMLIRDSIMQSSISEGEVWDPTTSEITIGKGGLFQIDISVMANVFYKTPLLGWTIAMMLGLRVTETSAANATYEARLDERVLYLNYNNAAFDGQDLILNGSIALSLQAGDKIIPRVWFNNTFIPSGTTDRRLDIWLNKSAMTHFSIYRVPNHEIKLG